jgi:Flp pilus assembly protein TadD
MGCSCRARYSTLMPRSDGPRTTSAGDRRSALIVMGIALLIRLIYLIQSSRNPYFYTPVFDGQNYDLLARGILRNGLVDPQLFWQPILYTLSLAGMYGITGGSVTAVRFLQCVVGAANCGLTVQLGKRILGARAGMLAGLVLAFYGPVIFYDAEPLANVWAELWTLVLLLLLTSPQLRPLKWFSVGCAGGLAILTRTTFLPFVIISAAWMYWKQRRTPGESRNNAGAPAAAGGIALVLLPAALLCYEVTGKLTFFPASSGLNLYLGNNPRSREMEAMRGWEVVRLRREAEQHGQAGIWGENVYFSQLTKQYLRNDPADAIAHWLRKAAAFITAREIPSYEDVYLYREYSSLMWLLVWKIGRFGFPFGVLLPLAMVGLATHLRKLPFPFLLFMLLEFLSITSAHVVTRTRTSIIPLLAILAAAGVLWLVNEVRGRDWTKLIGAAACIAVVLIATTRPGPFGLEGFPSSELEVSAGFYAQQMNRPEAAIEHYRRAVVIEPGNASAHFNLGTLLSARNERAAAIDEYRQAIRLASQYPEFHYNLGNALAGAGQNAEAIEAFEQAVKLDPTLAQAHYNLGYLLTDIGKTQEAIGNYQQAVRFAPRMTEAWVNLGMLLEQNGDLKHAAAAYQSALRDSPGLPLAERRLRALATRPRS